MTEPGSTSGGRPIEGEPGTRASERDMAEPAAGSRPDSASEPSGAEPGGAPPLAPARPQHVVERTRAGGLWTAVAAGLIVLVAILIFVVQNGAKVKIHLLGFGWTLPLGVALLIATLLGAVLMATIGTVRILQLRRVASRHDYRDRRRARKRPR